MNYSYNLLSVILNNNFVKMNERKKNIFNSILSKVWIILCIFNRNLDWLFHYFMLCIRLIWRKNFYLWESFELFEVFIDHLLHSFRRVFFRIIDGVTSSTFTFQESFSYLFNSYYYMYSITKLLSSIELWNRSRLNSEK